MTEDEHVEAISNAVKELNRAMDKAAFDRFETELEIFVTATVNGCAVQKVRGTVKRLATRI